MEGGERDLSMYSHSDFEYRSFVTDEDYGQLKLKINGIAIDLRLRLFCTVSPRNREKYLSVFRKETPALIATLSRSH